MSPWPAATTTLRATLSKGHHPPLHGIPHLSSTEAAPHPRPEPGPPAAAPPAACCAQRHA
eukprot:1151483-Pelagomonas_calceolata.AAC.6